MGLVVKTEFGKFTNTINNNHTRMTIITVISIRILSNSSMAILVFLKNLPLIFDLYRPPPARNYDQSPISLRVSPLPLTLWGLLGVSREDGVIYWVTLTPDLSLFSSIRAYEYVENDLKPSSITAKALVVVSSLLEIVTMTSFSLLTFLHSASLPPSMKDFLFVMFGC